MKSVIRRLKGAVVITLDEAQHAKCLSSLRDRNNDLSTLRLQINALQEHPSNRKRIVVPTHYNTIQIAAKKLYEALCEAWCCDDAAHRSHYAKLCLDAKVQSEVQLDLAISCHELDVNPPGRSEHPYLCSVNAFTDEHHPVHYSCHQYGYMSSQRALQAREPIFISSTNLYQI
jgi:hypothetical protein